MAFADFKNALNDTKEIELTTTVESRDQGSRPVWFVTQDESLYLLPVTGSDSPVSTKTCSRRRPFAWPREEASTGPGPRRSPMRPGSMRSWRAFGRNKVPRDIEAYYPKRDVALEVAPAHGAV